MSNKTFQILIVSLLVLILLALTHWLQILIGIVVGFTIGLGWQIWLVIFALILIGQGIYKTQHKTDVNYTENPN